MAVARFNLDRLLSSVCHHENLMVDCFIKEKISVFFFSYPVSSLQNLATEKKKMNALFFDFLRNTLRHSQTRAFFVSITDRKNIFCAEFTIMFAIVVLTLKISVSKLFSSAKFLIKLVLISLVALGGKVGKGANTFKSFKSIFILITGEKKLFYFYSVRRLRDGTASTACDLLGTAKKSPILGCDYVCFGCIYV
ncbi:uncharacterized protein EV154DRAFT_485034 [Mucor mucedo]|uniref:uncharacterized protein n=1 Tax=Mucor mucedo TaxID=29922 RepID=UPI00221FEF6C|nr:uncharacterized protein EV154DRAFT_485034 [Mucor mucedo]KAI7886841.1 hypothetical protein EV154DRAFT_485034 [Mucor mucedo]